MKKAIRTIGMLVAWLGVQHRRARAQDGPVRGPNREATRWLVSRSTKAWPKALTRSGRPPWVRASPRLCWRRAKFTSLAAKAGEKSPTCLDAESGPLWQDKFATKPVTGIAAGGGKFAGVRRPPRGGRGQGLTLGVNGVISCLNAANGKVVWRNDTKTKPRFYTSTSPLIADGKCVVYIGDLTAFDLADGAVTWKWTGGGIPYGSPVLMTVDGVKQIVTPTQGDCRRTA